jgi:hypothetical protein
MNWNSSSHWPLKTGFPKNSSIDSKFTSLIRSINPSEEGTATASKEQHSLQVM